MIFFQYSNFTGLWMLSVFDADVAKMVCMSKYVIKNISVYAFCTFDIAFRMREKLQNVVFVLKSIQIFRSGSIALGVFSSLFKFRAVCQIGVFNGLTTGKSDFYREV